MTARSRLRDGTRRAERRKGQTLRERMNLEGRTAVVTSGRRAKHERLRADAKMIAIVERLAPVVYPAILERLGGPT